MKFKILLAVLILYSITILAQKTKNRVQVAGTKISLVPPSGFNPSKDFTGFKKGNATINIMDIAGGNYFANTATFTREAFEEQGITVYDFQETEINGYSAKYIHVAGDTNTKSYNLVFGDSTFSVMLFAAYPAKNKGSEDALKASIFTAQYDKSIIIDPFETATFTIDETSNAFKFAQATSSMFLYSLDGKKENMNGGPIVMILPLPADQSTTPEATCEQMVSGLQSQGFSNLTTSSNSAIEINGNKGHEILITGDMKGNNSYILVRVVKKGKRQVVIQGIMTGNIDYIDAIRELSETLQIK